MMFVTGDLLFRSETIRMLSVRLNVYRKQQLYMLTKP
jgi:hypothetical protein